MDVNAGFCMVILVCKSWQLACRNTVVSSMIVPVSNRVTSDVVKDLSKWKRLVHLSLEGHSLTAGAVEELMVGCTELSFLDLSRCHQVAGALDLERLAGCKRLSSLNLSGCYNLTDDGLDKLVGCSQLSSLNLTKCRLVAEAGLASGWRASASSRSLA